MFTGIVAGQGRVLRKSPSGGGMTFGLGTDFLLDDPRLGESIAVNGVCLTATTISGHRFTVDVSPESLGRTNLGSLGVGAMVNLERALRLSDRLGGHLVSGHVDATVPVVERRSRGDFVLFTFGLPRSGGRYVIEKGSIAVDGISLTVNRCDRDSFEVAVIPHTLEVTTLGVRHKGDQVNIEFDLIGKYVEKLLGPGGAPPSEARRSGATIDTAFLAAHDFLK